MITDNKVPSAQNTSLRPLTASGRSSPGARERSILIWALPLSSCGTLVKLLSHSELWFHHLQILKQDKKKLIKTPALRVHYKEGRHSTAPGPRYVLNKEPFFPIRMTPELHIPFTSENSLRKSLKIRTIHNQWSLIPMSRNWILTPKWPPVLPRCPQTPWNIHTLGLHLISSQLPLQTMPVT